MQTGGVVSARRVVALSLAFALAFVPGIGGASAAAETANASLHGTVAYADKATPVSGAKVHAVHLDTRQVFDSAPTGANGAYQITGLPYGYYDLAVETPEGSLYLANRVISAPPGEKLEISLMLGPPAPEDTEWWSAEPDRRIPGLERVPDGVARVVEGKARAVAAAPAPSGPTPATPVGAAAKKSSLKPVLIGGGIAVLAVILLAGGGGSSSAPPVSPFTP